MHKPMSKLNPGQPENVAKILVEHLDDKGLLLDSDAGLRRPRTIFMTSSNFGAVMAADCIFHVCGEHGRTYLIQIQK